MALRRSTAALVLAAAAALCTPHCALATSFTGDGTAYTLGSISSGNCNMMAANS
ncbi:unnamed protein product, partial [Globisporangium polare]